MDLIFIAGSWGSGTTAAIGALDKLGIPTFGPHFMTSDERTQNSYELQAFRKLVFNFVDEPTVSFKANYENGFIPALRDFKQQIQSEEWPELPNPDRKIFALKMPLASICLPKISEVFNTKIILIQRPFVQIEKSRIRRKWPELYGGKGAQKIYNDFYISTINFNLSYLAISHHDLISDSRNTLRKIIDYCEIDEFKENLDNADAFIRKA